MIGRRDLGPGWSAHVKISSFLALPRRRGACQPPPLILGLPRNYGVEKAFLPWTPRDQDLHESSLDFEPKWQLGLPPRLLIIRATFVLALSPRCDAGLHLP